MGQSIPIEFTEHPAETIALLQSLLDEIWAELTDVQRNQIPRSLVADRLLRAAVDRERDRRALRLYALSGIESADIPD